MTERQRARETTGGTTWKWLARATPLLIATWVLEPRIATNRPSYGFRETLILCTAVLTIPCFYAVARVAGRQTRPASRTATVRQWLWSATAAFAFLPVVLSVAGSLAPLPSSFPDDQIPGLESGLAAAAGAVILAALLLCWKALRRLTARGNQPAPAQQQ